MNMFEYDNSMLQIEETLVKSTKKSIRISIVMIIVCIILIPLYIYLGIIDDNIWSKMFDFFISAIWVFNLILNIKTRKKSKKNLKNFTNAYYDRLKKIDNPRYLKETRSKKLKKLGF